MSTEASASVQRHVLGMIATEHDIETALGRLQRHARENEAVAAAVKRLHTMAGDHKNALEHRLQKLRAASDMLSHNADSDLAAALCELSGALSRAALEYSVLHAIAHRAFDRDGDGTRDLVKKHLGDYARAVTEINGMVFDAVVSEFEATGEDCRCQCTTCALGLCTCAPMGVGRAHKEWLETVSSGALGSILMGPPRRDSAAARAGLRAGDVILAADGHDIHANQELHAAIKDHKPGESVQLRVRRASGEVQDIDVAC